MPTWELPGDWARHRFGGRVARLCFVQTASEEHVAFEDYQGAHSSKSPVAPALTFQSMQAKYGVHRTGIRCGQGSSMRKEASSQSITPGDAYSSREGPKRGLRGQLRRGHREVDKRRGHGVSMTLSRDPMPLRR